MTLPQSLLTLRLSSPSFLETIITNANIPIYSTETTASTTTLSRCDPYHGLSLVAHVHWPERHSSKGKSKDSSPAQISMDGSIKSEDDLLKRNRLNTSRKFRIPGHSESLKWKRVQGIFHCTTSTGSTVATFEPAILTAAARLSVYVPTLSGLPQSQGCVSWLLADYLIVTAMLLLTHHEDWQGFAPSAPASASSSTTHIPLHIPRSSPAPMPLAQSPPASPLVPHFPHHPKFHTIPHARSHAQFSRSPTTASSYSYGTPSPQTRSHSPSASSVWDTASSHSSSQSEKQRRLAVVNYESVPQQSRQPYYAQQRQHQTSYEFDVQVPDEEPPPYEQIQWTVRLRQPRRTVA
ncbi:hypothetical protein M422DRAFT_780907 [Sphaerobolus stellatus SS14]|uniref:Uncharacterized protein n=1 Tax=Sphaerobolus stellatus (strain SS14) TaxID=990650 RepID=A0A0C9VPX0_SPHS4|nr:hypothetical protein M422DRAFT_780907 [Sphaerobolus stellatus SS14]